jgi:hypothetical protein
VDNSDIGIGRQVDGSARRELGIELDCRHPCPKLRPDEP